MFSNIDFLIFGKLIILKMLLDIINMKDLK